MKSWTTPTAEDLDRVVALSARSENRAYFFERLDNPEWVEPLAKRGFFEDPPPPVPAPEPGYVRFPPWPEGRYLVRAASSVPDSVRAVLATIERSENPTVTRLLLESVAALPMSHAIDLSDRVLDWIEGPHADFYADDAAAVVVHFCGAGQIGPAVEMIRSLLRVLPDPRVAEKGATADSPTRVLPDASARMTPWEYQRVVEQLLGPLVDLAGLDAVRLFDELLGDALRLSRWEEETPSEGRVDYSYIWRPAIEDHPQNMESGVKNVLVAALRDAALQYASRGPSQLGEVVGELLQGSTVHGRIALHVLAKANNGVELVTRLLEDRRLFDDHRLRHEYADLLRSRFEDVSGDAQSGVLGWIESGPDLDWFRQRRTDADGAPPSEDEFKHYADLWQRDRYALVAPSLVGDAADRYRELLATYGEPEHPDFLSWTGSWAGPESPVERDELLDMGPANVIELLRTWRPDDDSGWHFGPSIEGLGRTFGGVVAARARDFAMEASRLAGADPTYVRELFSGLEGALKQGEPFPWEEPLRLALWVSQQPFEPDEEVSYRDRDPGFRWCRRQISSLLRAGLSAKDNGVPIELRDLVWEILARLVNDANPSPEHEARYGGDNMDPLTLSINTNRGEAMHAVVEYALWVHRGLENRGDDVSVGLDVMPEVRDVLETHLHIDAEPSHAVRAVYGRWLPWLILIDREWTSSHLPAIFPEGIEGSDYADTAWSTYVTWCPPYDSAFGVLRLLYESAIDRVPSNRKAGSLRKASVDAKLGEHLATFYWRGIVDQSVLGRFFGRADDELAASVLAFVGRALLNTSGDLSASIRDRLQELFELRLANGELAPQEHQRELRAFGIWFSSDKLDADWALEKLGRTVHLAGAPTLAHLAVERLVDVAVENPVAAVDLLAGMLARPEHEWDFEGWRDEVERVLRIVSDSGNPDAFESMSEIVDLYVRRGRYEFRAFAPASSESESDRD
jgi:hypothetical protein